MVNYKYGKIYKITDNTTNKIYIGSTCKYYLSQRLSAHVEGYMKYLSKTNYKTHYVSSYEILKNKNYTITLLEKCPCDSKDELHARERYHIEKNECVNLLVPGRTIHEWKRDKCEDMRKYNAEYIKRPDVIERNKEAGRKYDTSEKGKALRKYNDRMRRQWGDSYCNSLLFISWDVFK